MGTDSCENIAFTLFLKLCGSWFEQCDKITFTAYKAAAHSSKLNIGTYIDRFTLIIYTDIQTIGFEHIFQCHFRSTTGSATDNFCPLHFTQKFQREIFNGFSAYQKAAVTLGQLSKNYGLVFNPLQRSIYIGFRPCQTNLDFIRNHSSHYLIGTLQVNQIYFQAFFFKIA